MVNNDENQNKQSQTDVIKVDAGTFFNEKFQALEERLIDSVQITSHQSSKLFEKITTLVVETRQLSETFDQKAFDNAITQLREKITEVQTENRESIDKILEYLNKIATLMLSQKEDVDAGEDKFATLYEKFADFEGRITQSLYVTNKEATLLFEKMNELLEKNGEKALQPAQLHALVEEIDSAEQSIAKEHQQARLLTDVAQTALLNEMHQAIQELCKGLDYDLLADKIVAKLPNMQQGAEGHSFTFLPTATAPVEANIDYALLTEKIQEVLPNISVDVRDLEDRIVQLLNSYLPTMTSQLVNYDILVDKITEKVQPAENASKTVEYDFDVLVDKIVERLSVMQFAEMGQTAELRHFIQEVQANQSTVQAEEIKQLLADFKANAQPTTATLNEDKFTDRVLEQLSNLTESIINYDLLAEKLAQGQTATQEMHVVEAMPTVQSIDESALANKVVELLPEFINYRLITEIIEENVKGLQTNLQDNQEYIIQLLQQTKTAAIVAETAAIVAGEEANLAEIEAAATLENVEKFNIDEDSIANKIVEKLGNIYQDILAKNTAHATQEVVEQKEIVAKVDEASIIDTLLKEIPEMMEAVVNYDIIAEKLANYIPEQAIENASVAVDYDVLADKIAARMPEANTEVANTEIDYEALVERLAERMPVAESASVAVDYDVLADKIAARMPEANTEVANTEIDYEALVERLAERMPVAESASVEVDYDVLADKIAARMPEANTEVANTDIDYEALVERLAERMPVAESASVEVDYDVLADKIAARMPEVNTEVANTEIDYELLADKVAARIPDNTVENVEIDYEKLAERVAAQLKEELVLPEVASVDASTVDFANIATTLASHMGMQDRAENLSDALIEKFNQVSDKIDRVQDDVNLIFNAYKLPEMTRLDKNIAIYNQAEEEENLVAILLNANTLVTISENYFENGNQEDAQQVLNVLYNKLNAIQVKGAGKIEFILETLTSYGMEKNFEEEKLNAFTDAVSAFSATNVRFDSALAHAVIDSKFNLLQNSVQNKLDKSVYNELENLIQDDAVDMEDTILQLKNELIALPLSVFVNCNLPMQYVEVSEDIQLPIDALVEAIYDRLHDSMTAPKTEKKPLPIKRRRVLRPALTKRGPMDSLLPQDTALKIVHRKINLEKSEQSLFALFEDRLQSK